MELGCDKFPSEAELYPEWKRNKEALLSFLESVSIAEGTTSLCLTQFDTVLKKNGNDKNYVNEYIKNRSLIAFSACK